MILLANFLNDFFVGVDPVKLVDFFTRLILCCTTLFILIRYIYDPNNGQLYPFSHSAKICLSLPISA